MEEKDEKENATEGSNIGKNDVKVVSKKSGKGLGITALVLAIISLILSVLPLMYFPIYAVGVISVISIILAIIALRKKFGKLMPVIALVLNFLAILIAIIVLIGSINLNKRLKLYLEASESYKESNNEESLTDENENKSLTDSNKEESSESIVAAMRALSETMKLFDEGLAFDSGSYVKGEIPKGEYAFIGLTGASGYYSEETIAGEIIDNENFSSFGYVYVHGVGDVTTRGLLVNISAFTKLNVSGAKELYELINEHSDYNESGMYKVGNDIKAGEYIVESIGGRGYFSIVTGPVGNKEIIRNDNFNGKKSVLLKKGDYLELSRAMIIK